MYCAKCGTLNSDGARFCSACGYPMQRDFSSPPPGSTTIYAGFWKRFGAYIIDEIILSTVGIIVLLVFGGMIGLSMEMSGVDEDVIAPIVVLNIIAVDTILNWLYFTILESSSRRATLGKMALGIAVSDMYGRRISFMRANARFWSKIISGLFLGIGYIIAGFTERKQALHDLIAGTLVING